MTHRDKTDKDYPFVLKVTSTELDFLLLGLVTYSRMLCGRSLPYELEEEAACHEAAGHIREVVKEMSALRQICYMDEGATGGLCNPKSWADLFSHVLDNTEAETIRAHWATRNGGEEAE